MTWAENIVCQFEVPPPPYVNGVDLHGAYNKLLSSLFPPDSDFAVVPQLVESTSTLSPNGCFLTLEVLFVDRPVLILELTNARDIINMSTRRFADEQMRLRLGDLYSHCPLSTLHAVSAMGTQLCFYSVNTTDPAMIKPLRILEDSSEVNDLAPASRWNCDILTADGERRFRQVTEEIKQWCAKSGLHIGAPHSTIAWSEKVVHQFKAVTFLAGEVDLHGAYNKLLSTLFPPDSDFTVVPRFVKIMSTLSPHDHFVTFEVLFNNRPVLILELMDAGDITDLLIRRFADEQLRLRLGDLYSHCPLPTLHAASAMGAQLSFYGVNTTNPAKIKPPRIVEDARVYDLAPASRWDCDILTPDGERRFRQVTEEIKEGCAKLG